MKFSRCVTVIVSLRAENQVCFAIECVSLDAVVEEGNLEMIVGFALWKKNVEFSEINDGVFYNYEP